MNECAECFYGAELQLKHHAPEMLQEALGWPYHSPHMALLLTFMQLFEHARSHLNEMTGRHLDFFYEKILQFKQKESKPDEVHLMFELAKQVDSHLLKSGVQFKAGKDSKGNELLYQTEAEIVLNKARIGTLKSVYIDHENQSRVYAAPVANSADGEGAPLEEEGAGWKAFGESQYALAADKTSMIEAGIGFAIASPQLLLTEGQREICLTVTLAGEDGDDLSTLSLASDALQFFLSGSAGWIEATCEAVEVSGSSLNFKLTLSESLPPVVGYDDEVLAAGLTTDFPVLKAILNTEGASYAYGALKDMSVASIDIGTEVSGMQQLLLHNDRAVIKPGKPFQPFGASPVEGSALYIGSEEVFNKNLEHLSLEIDWHGLPQSNLYDYYSNYGQTPASINTGIQSNESFSADISMLIDGDWGQTLGTTVALFDLDDAKLTRTIDCDIAKNIGRAIAPQSMELFDTGCNRGYIKLELNSPDFQHGNYVTALTRVAMAQSQLSISPPYTPVIKSLKLGYKSSQSFEPEVEHYFHLHPFGFSKAEFQNGVMPMLPGFYSRSDGDEVDHEGEFYIGVEGLEPRQNLSILFQVAEGSGIPELALPEIHWSYLSNNQWLPFEDGQICSDSTRGLIASGIITFDVPKAATNSNTVLPEGFHWIRAAVRENSSALCDMVKVAAQAVRASRIIAQEADGESIDALAAGTISKLKVSNSAIKSISQPFASFGGSSNEDRSLFYTRVSERLRHKQRGITIWDYERLVLERFPGIYKVKCINHTDYLGEAPGGDCCAEFAPGYVTVAVVPSLKNKNAVDPLQPRASLANLDEIKAYLSDKISPFAARGLRVINPYYEQIQVEFSVRFNEGYDWGYYKEQLNQSIISFLSPWVSGQAEQIIFGGRIHFSVILNHIEEQTYVDHVTDFRMDHLIGAEIRRGVDEAIPTTSRSILVSHHKHLISETVACV